MVLWNFSRIWDKLLLEQTSNFFMNRAPETITLALMSVSVTILISMPLGILAALNPNSLIDRMALGIAVTAQATLFKLGLMMLIFLAIPIFQSLGIKLFFICLTVNCFRSKFGAGNVKANENWIVRCYNVDFNEQHARLVFTDGDWYLIML